MVDLLVSLYDLPPRPPLADAVIVRRAMAYEKEEVLRFVRQNWHGRWSSEADAAFSSHPIRCFVSIEAGAITGFSCYDCTFRGFLGPMGVTAQQRGRGLGEVLLSSALAGLLELGYAYAIIGDVGEARPFYEKTVRARVIEGSEPGPYRYELRAQPDE